MSLADYRESQSIAAAHPALDALLMAAMRRANTDNADRLAAAFPQLWDEFVSRDHTPHGVLPSEEGSPA